MIRALLLLFAALLISTASHAAPAISSTSGTPTDGSSYTLSGSGYGSGPSEVEFLGGSSGPIESGTTGNNFSRTNWLLPGEAMNSNDFKYATDQAHSGSKSLKAIVPEYNAVLRYTPASTITSSESVFISVWYRWNHVNEGQWKLLRLTATNSIVDQYTDELVFFTYPDETQICVDPKTVGYSSMTPNPYTTTDAWQRFDFDVTGGVSNGIVTLTKYVTGSSKVTDTEGAYPTHRSGGAWNYVMFQNYMGTGGGYPGISSGNVWMDDIYIASTRARVEMGNASTYAACTHFEIQPFTSWASGSITVTLNRGSFGATDTVYMYVVNADGTYNSSGYQVVLGGSDTTPPALVSATNSADGYTAVLVFNEVVNAGAGGNAGWSANFSVQGALPMVYFTGLGTNTLMYTINGVVLQGETGTISYTQPGNGIEDAAGNDLATIASSAITNNSTRGPSITISSPTASSTYSTSTSTLYIAGTATEYDLSTVTWSNSAGGSGACTGTSTWSKDGITLYTGTNIITVTVTDDAGNTATDTLTVTYAPSTPSTGGVVVSGCTLSGLEIN
jgi:hypothetical protein